MEAYKALDLWGKMMFRVAVILALVALSGCGGSVEKSASSKDESTDASPSNGTDAILDQMAGEPQFIWLATLKRLYPNDYETVRETMRSIGAEKSQITAARLTLSKAMGPIMARHKEAAKRSSDATLMEYFRRNTAVAEVLMVENTKACTDVFHGNLDPTINLRDSTWKLMSEATAQLLVAASEGEATPTKRPDAQLSRDDFGAWRAAMEQVGADDDTFALLTDPSRRALASDEEKCRVRLQMMQGALQLSPALSTKVVLTVLG